MYARTLYSHMYACTHAQHARMHSTHIARTHRAHTWSMHASYAIAGIDEAATAPRGGAIQDARGLRACRAGTHACAHTCRYTQSMHTQRMHAQSTHAQSTHAQVTHAHRARTAQHAHACKQACMHRARARTHTRMYRARNGFSMSEPQHAMVSPLQPTLGGWVG